VSAFSEGTFDGKPMIFADYGDILVWGDKVNPKKSPYVRLYYAPGGNISNVVDTVVVPSDLPEGWSIIVGDAAQGEGTRRWMCPTPTRGTENTATTGLVRIGPNVGPLYEKPGQGKTTYASEFAAPVPPAVPGEDYSVTLPINGVMNPDGTFAPRAADQIQSVKFVYRKDLDDATLVTNEVNLATKTTDANWGDQYTATIPSSYFPAAGHLMQWKVLITDGEGVEWTSPSFNNKDDGYEWYGTIVEPDSAAQMSGTLPTWHMFASGSHLTQMDVDADKQNLSLVPHNARVAIYDSSTSNYYDYVRIDLRSNTSAGFTKKGHGLRFAKSHPMTMQDGVTGETFFERLPGNTGMANPWTDVTSADEAAAGADVGYFMVPENNTDYNGHQVYITEFRCMEHLAEARGSIGAAELTIRKGLKQESDDVSGDYNEYAHSWSFKTDDGFTVNCYGNEEGKTMKAIWLSDNFSYSINVMGQGDVSDTYGLDDTTLKQLIEVTQ